MSDETNTDKAFRAIDSALNRNVKNIAPRDHTLLRNSLIAYFKSNDYIDYDTMIQNTLESYHPVELDQEKMDKVIEKIRELPENINLINSLIQYHQLSMLVLEKCMMSAKVFN